MEQKQLSQEALEARKEYHRQYRQRNKEKMKEYRRIYWEKKAAQIQESYSKNHTTANHNNCENKENN